MTFSKRDIQKRLTQKFKFEPVEGSRHEAFALFQNGKKVATTRFSRGANEPLGDNLLKLMARELGVHRVSFFREMLICTKSQEDYLALLKKNGLL